MRFRLPAHGHADGFAPLANAIRKTVKDLNGVREVSFVGGGVIVMFNPIGITKEEICTAIRRSGYRATEITSSPGDAGKPV